MCFAKVYLNERIVDVNGGCTRFLQNAHRLCLYDSINLFLMQHYFVFFLDQLIQF